MQYRYHEVRVQLVACGQQRVAVDVKLEADAALAFLDYGDPHGGGDELEEEELGGEDMQNDLQGHRNNDHQDQEQVALFVVTCPLSYCFHLLP